jgi:hypothetical protein
MFAQPDQSQNFSSPEFEQPGSYKNLIHGCVSGGPGLGLSRTHASVSRASTLPSYLPTKQKTSLNDVFSVGELASLFRHNITYLGEILPHFKSAAMFFIETMVRSTKGFSPVNLGSSLSCYCQPSMKVCDLAGM